MGFWTIKTFDISNTFYKKQYNKYDENMEKNWILNHIHDATQMLIVVCDNDKILNTSVLLNGKLRKESNIIHSLISSGATDNEIYEFLDAYNEWYELYKIPNLTESEFPIIATAVYSPEKNTTFIKRIKNIFDSFLSKRVYPLKTKIYFTDE